MYRIQYINGTAVKMRQIFDSMFSIFADLHFNIQLLEGLVV